MNLEEFEGKLREKFQQVYMDGWSQGWKDGAITLGNILLSNIKKGDTKEDLIITINAILGVESDEQTMDKRRIKKE